MNLQTGYKEAKLLQEDDHHTSLVNVESDQNDDSESSTDVDLEEVKSRMEAALKNIPSDKFDEMTEEKWKEISGKYKTYDELKKDLKDLKLEIKSENEMMTELVERFQKIIDLKDAKHDSELLTILEDIKYLSHSIDNSLFFISIGGLENVILPNLNHSNAQIIVMSLKTMGVILQNNDEAKTYAIEKTNIGNYLINFLSKSINSHDKLSASLFAMGSLLRNNRKMTSELFKKGLSILIEIIANERSKDVSLPLKTKALTLVGDLLDESKNRDFATFFESLKVCGNIENFVVPNRNGLIADIDSTEKVISSLVTLKALCEAKWSESPSFRHNLLVIENNLSIQHDVDVYSETISMMKELNKFLYGHLRIADDDLSQKYEKKSNDEL